MTDVTRSPADREKTDGTTTVAVIGAGSMGEALMAGVLRAGHPVERMTASVRSAARAGQLRERHGIAVVAVEEDPEANRRAAEGADLVILAVKPYQILATAAEIAPVLSPGAVVVSVAAGITQARLAAALPGIAVVRSMPNTPSLIGQGVIALVAGPGAGDAEIALVRSILSAAGLVLVVGESQLDAVTALSGSGPAYFFLLAEAMVAAGEELGLSSELARQLVVKTAAGAGALLEATDEDPGDLRAKVTSPGGTTAAAIGAFQSRGLEDIVRAATQAAARRSVEMTKE